MISTIRRVSLCAAILLGTVLASQVRAAMVSFTPTPVDLNDLDHHMVYTWRLDNINLNGGTISSASLTFTNIANWDTNANVLHLWLLDTAKNAGVSSFVDDPTNSSPVTDLTDDFLSTRFHSNSGWLVANGTAQTFLADKSFTTTPSTYTINFTPAQLAVLQQYISHGNDIAFGIDPDCHFFNDGVNFNMNVTPVPEMNALFPLVGLLAAVSSTHFLRRRRMARVSARDQFCQ
jgi:hypothetical protein